MLPRVSAREGTDIVAQALRAGGMAEGGAVKPNRGDGRAERGYTKVRQR